MAAIFERHHQALQRYCYSIVGNSHDAADALQNTMIKALRALPGEARQLALRPWLYRIAHNESISLLRARRPESDLGAAAHISDAAATGALESREQLRSLTEDLSELTERQRGALLMRELGGLEFTEVAEAMGTSASAAKQSAYEARCALQAMVDGRAMDCETVRRTLSDGDRRMLRGMRVRGHLRACPGCSGFEAAMRRRPAQLTALIPPLPAAAAAAMLHGILGGGSTGGGGGLAAGLLGITKATAGSSLAVKAGAAVAVSATLAGGAIYAIPELGSTRSARPTPRNESVLGARTPRSTPSEASNARTSRGSTATGSPGEGAATGDGARPGAGKPIGSGKAGDIPGDSPSSGAGRSVGTSGGKSSDAGTSDGSSGASRPDKPAETSGGGAPATGTPAGSPGGPPAGTPHPPPGVPVSPGGTRGASGCSGRSEKKSGKRGSKSEKKGSSRKRDDDEECDD